MSLRQNIEFHGIKTVHVRQARSDDTWFEVTLIDANGHKVQVTIWSEKYENIQFLFGDDQP